MSKKVRVGIIGTSWWVDLMYVPSLHNYPGAEVAAVCGRNSERAAEIAMKFGGARVFTDYREMIAAGGIDAVVIAVPDDLHREMTIAALDAGLHVLCEKPLANSLADADEMLSRAEVAGVKHMVLFTWRWQPHWRYVKHLVDTGYIGRPLRARFAFISGAAFQEGSSGQWRYDGRRATGAAGDLGSHMIDFAHWYLGGVTAVLADLPILIDQSAKTEHPPQPVNDACLMILEMQSGARAEIDVSRVSFLADQVIRLSVQLFGDQGAIEAEHVYFGVDSGVTLRGARIGDTRIEHGATIESTRLAPLVIPEEYFAGGVGRNVLFDPYSKQSTGVRHFVDCIRDNRPAKPDFSDGVRVQEVLEAAFRSNAERRRISL
jgi:predicted dehydrogenase